MTNGASLTLHGAHREHLSHSSIQCFPKPCTYIHFGPLMPWLVRVMTQGPMRCHLSHAARMNFRGQQCQNVYPIFESDLTSAKVAKHF